MLFVRRALSLPISFHTLSFPGSRIEEPVVTAAKRRDDIEGGDLSEEMNSVTSCSHPRSNWGPFACEASVITTTLWELRTEVRNTSPHANRTINSLLLTTLPQSESLSFSHTRGRTSPIWESSEVTSQPTQEQLLPCCHQTFEWTYLALS